MKKMATMVTVTATEMNSTQWAVECSDCGPLSLTSATKVDRECITHFDQHRTGAPMKSRFR